MEDNKLNALKPGEGSTDANKPAEQPKVTPAPAPAAQPKIVSVDNFADKSKDQLKQEAKDDKKEFGSAGVDDINKNLGSFGPTVVAAQEQPKEVKLDVDAKVVEKAAKEKIDFERFKKTKKTEKAAKTRFGEKVSMMLRSRKGFVTTWVLEIVIMALIMAAGITCVALFTKWVGFKNAEIGGPMFLPEVQKYIKPGVVFGWICIFPCLVPLLYLLTTWFIGINQVASSRLYHFLFWGFGAFSLICLIICLGLLGPAMDAWLNFPAYW